MATPHTGYGVSCSKDIHRVSLPFELDEYEDPVIEERKQMTINISVPMHMELPDIQIQDNEGGTAIKAVYDCSGLSIDGIRSIV